MILNNFQYNMAMVKNNLMKPVQYNSPKKLINNNLSFCGSLSPYTRKFENAVVFYMDSTSYSPKCIKFKKDMPVFDAIYEILKIKRLDTSCIGQSPVRLLMFANAVNQSKLFNTFKVSEARSGVNSLALMIDNSKVLKLSRDPNYPNELRPFDIPILEKDIISIRNEPVYYCIQERADTENVTEAHVREVINNIYKSNYKPARDLYESRTDQVGLYNGKPYLIDSECAVSNVEMSKRLTIDNHYNNK